MEEAGKYITLLNRGKFARGWQPTWADTVKTIGSVDFDKVIDAAGQESLTRNALPIESATDVGPARRIERGGNAEVDRRQRTLLQSFVDTVHGENEGRRMTLAQISTLLNRIPGFKTAQILARINMKSRISSTLRLFPDLFEIQGNYVAFR